MAIDTKEENHLKERVKFSKKIWNDVKFGFLSLIAQQKK